MDIRGVYGFSSLMKQNKKAKNYADFCFAGFFFKIFYVNFFINAPLITTGNSSSRKKNHR
jgi:hypothetical protein